MNPLQNSYDKNIDRYIETNTEEKGKVRLIHENLLKRLPPDILQEMARRQLAEIKKAGYDVPEPKKVTGAGLRIRPSVCGLQSAPPWGYTRGGFFGDATVMVA